MTAFQRSSPGHAAPRDERDVYERRGVHGKQVLAALRAVPRETFLTMGAVPGEPPWPPPDALARMIDALGVDPSARVLHLGSQQGFVAAVLSRLAREVFTTSGFPGLFEAAGMSNVRVLDGAPAEAAAPHAPFDAILVSTPTLGAPLALRPLLAEGASLVAALQPHGGRQRLVRATRKGALAFAEDDLGEHRYLPLLGDVLVTTGVLARAVVELLVRTAADHGLRLSEELVQSGTLNEAQVYRALAVQYGVGAGDVQTLLEGADPALFHAVPRAFLTHNRILPLRRDKGVLAVAIQDPETPTWEVAQVLGAHGVEAQLVTPTDFRRLWTALEQGRTSAAPPPDGEAAAGLDPDLAAPSTGPDGGMVALGRAILLDAIGERASDVHLERYENVVRVRFRVDGSLRDVPRYRLTPEQLVAIVNVTKVAGDMDISERRLPQGGRFRRRAGAAVYDFRVQTQPSLYGEHLVVRILPQERKALTIEDLGFSPPLANQYRRLLGNPHGMVLVVGPTGSGKSTTLYAGLQLLAKDTTRKVITIEDPVEYATHGIQQVKAHPEIGFAFADAMRAFVREDPDVIFVGEIRDGETALEAIRASQTGHLVLSTLHCNDTVDAVQRLYDLGMHPNSIASELTAVVSQRLARRICPSCRRPAAPDAAVLSELFPAGAPSDLRCFEGAGCAQCRGFGTRGRVAVIEFLVVSATMRKAISRRPVLDELRDLAFESGLSPLRDDALRLVGEGVIPMSELPDVLSAEQMAPRGASPPRT